MNATQTLILANLTVSNSQHTVSEIAKALGKGKSTVRAYLKSMVAEGSIVVTMKGNQKFYTNAPEAPITLAELSEAFASKDEISTDPQADLDNAESNHLWLAFNSDASEAGRLYWLRRSEKVSAVSTF